MSILQHFEPKDQKLPEARNCQIRRTNITELPIQKNISKCKNRLKNLPINRQPSHNHSTHFASVIIRGDCHARHIPGLVSDLTAPGTSVDGVCLPGAKLLDVLNSDQLEIGHNIFVINFNEIGRRYFTRHGQHLSMRGKRLLARMIVGGLVLSGSASTRLETRSPPPLLVTAPAVAVSPPILPTPAATNGEFCFAPRRSSGLQLLTYAEVVRVPSTPGGPGQPAPPQIQLHDAKVNNISPQHFFRDSTLQLH
ncbi:hypothetical protein J6590_056636 [Homalodisca vitripennis]|nr:hypothetical protein J6590_056636 [Homalodisca vitripennis]